VKLSWLYREQNIHIHPHYGCKIKISPILIFFHPILAYSSKIWLHLYNPWLTFGFFIQKKLYLLQVRNFIFVLSGCMQPTKRTLLQRDQTVLSFTDSSVLDAR
jgi:hypothetical protein